MSIGIMDPLHWLLWALAAAAFIVKAFAFIDAAIRPGKAYAAADKQTKNLWLVLLGVSLVVSLLWGRGFIGIFAIIGLIIALVYLADVRPAVRYVQGRGGSSQGPYGSR